MFKVLRSFPFSSHTVLSAQAATGVALLLGQPIVLFGIAVVLGMRLEATAPLAFIPLVLGYLLFFMLGVLIGVSVPSMVGVSMTVIVVVIALGVVGGAMIPVETLPAWVQEIAFHTPI